jgi:tryptophan synthase alpha chain
MSIDLLEETLEGERFHVSPFLVLGDPTPNASVELARSAVARGASMLEIGFPYGDPIADGPAIQAADLRALRGGTSTERAINLLSEIRRSCPKTPLNLLVYGNLVHARGYGRFCRDVAAAGASSLLVPDIPLDESEPLRSACEEAELGHVQLVGPLTDGTRLKRIDAATSAFVYLVAHQGVTGARNVAFAPVVELVSRTCARIERPLCLGFGLSRPEHIRSAREAGARIAVVGSYLAQAIGIAWGEQGADREKKVVTAFTNALKPLLAAKTPNDLPPEVRPK